MTETKKRSGYDRFLNILYIVCGAFAFTAYFVYFVKLLIWTEGTLSYVAAILAMLVSGIPLFFKRFWERILPQKVFFVLKNIFAWGMCFYMVTFLILCTYIFTTNSMQTHPEDLDSETVFVVYGAGLRGERPGSVLRKRLDKTAEYMEAVPGSVCIVTGGQGPDEVMPEADAMKNYLVEDMGIDPARIYTDPDSSNTIENIKNALAIMEKEGISDYTMVSVSNAFHIPRIKLICSRLDCRGEFVLAKDPNPYALFATLVREYMSYAKLFLMGTE